MSYCPASPGSGPMRGVTRTPEPWPVRRTEHSERRAALVIVLDGECGHAWELVIQQHKGNNYVETRVLPSSAAPQK
jgi:hypothetical protein